MFVLRNAMRAASGLALLATFARAQNSSLSGTAESPNIQCDYVVGAPVNTSSGQIWGHRAPNATAVSEYLGIPFAHSTNGTNRFAPPVRYYSDRLINGDKFGPVCAQSITPVPTFLDSNVYGILADVAGVGQSPSEDCLSINVWTKPQIGSRAKPVMVWIYGGGFTLGGTNTSTYSGQFWAEEEDVVFVNFNYRLGVFGFPGSPATTANVAFLDQRMALEWVRDNIANFGGDPNRITLFGESAGAASVDYYNYAWTSDPIIAGSIAESGEATSFGNKAADVAAANWYASAAKLGCGTNETSDDAAILACMRQPNITLEALYNATKPSAGLASILGSFGPTIDGVTVFANYTERGLTGQFIQKPAIVGNNDYEAGLFKLIVAGNGQVFPESFWTGLDQATFVCPSNTAAYFRYVNGVPVYRYRYFGMFPNLEIPTSPGLAYHSSEILPMFGASEEITGQDSTYAERELGRYMRNVWGTFAHCPDGGVERIMGWPKYSPMTNGTEGLVLIGGNSSSRVAFAPRGPYDGSCPLVFDTGAGLTGS